MCRWIAYSGNAVPMEELILKPEHSLVVQSLAATELLSLPSSSFVSPSLSSPFLYSLISV